MRSFPLALCFLFMLISARVDSRSFPFLRSLKVDDTNDPVPLSVVATARDPNSTAVLNSDSSPVPAPTTNVFAEPNNSTNASSDRGPSLAQACKSAVNDDVYGTRNSFVVTYIFELETTSDPILESRSIQTKLIRYLLKALMMESGLCNDVLNIGDGRKLAQALDGLWGIGSSSYPTILSMSCQDISESTSCFRMMGSVVLYFDESSSISYKGIKDIVLPLIHNNNIDVEPNRIVFESEEETEKQEDQVTNGSLAGVVAPEPQVLPQRQRLFGPVRLILITVLAICFTIGVGYLIFQKYVVVMRRPTNFIPKDMDASDDVSSMGVTQIISPCSSNDYDHCVSNAKSRNGSTASALNQDDISSDEEQPSLPHDNNCANDRQRKLYVRRQRELNRPRRKRLSQQYVPDTIEL